MRSDLVAAEWVKLRSLRSVWIAHAATALAVIAFNAGLAWDTYSHWTERDAADREEFVRDGIPLQMAFTGNAAMIMALALAAIGAVVIVGEYSTGTIRTTFAAVPARRSVMAAKVAVVTVAATVFGALVAGVSFALTQTILDRRGAGVSLGDPGAVRVVLASALLAPVCALAGLALGAVVRHTAATMTTSVVVVLVLPLAFTDGRYWSAVAGHALPYRAWLRLVDDGRSPTPFPWTAGGAWTIYAVWACAACALAVAGPRHRDQ
ncbi:ABC transporter permease [Streptomyces sp. MP131-18]|uniref:ABC transporter permease n=1 Tax=Streptomyces sp. MP131-18 TaxID=1857892 RepID=UPI0009C7B336|nr:ABC transporter permease [Streptomyces sp. MP131-18]ONK11674.1 ABC-type transport system involved in multi-copper enzyme maturation, permease component [Streptomyces sp. MP131-18]